MSDHNGFLDVLTKRFPEQVFLVNRYASGKLGFGADPVLRVFIPDLHWMSAASQKKYTGYHFNGKAPAPQRGTLFGALLDVLEKYRGSGGEMEVFQLGDRFDLWREATLGGKDLLKMYNRIRDDAELSPLADRLDVLGTRYLRGNHDHWLKLVEDRITGPHSRGRMLAGQGRIRLRHGHRYDQIERWLPDDFQAWAVQLYPGAKTGVCEIGRFSPSALKHMKHIQKLRRHNPALKIYPNPRPGGARLVKSPSDVGVLERGGSLFLDVESFSHGKREADDFENNIRFLEFGGKIWDHERTSRASRVVYVIGHTHHARMLVDKHPKTGGPLVTMDCGGWVGKCTVVSPGEKTAHVAPSAQFGVQCGDDLRIYQLGGNA